MEKSLFAALVAELSQSQRERLIHLLKSEGDDGFDELIKNLTSLVK